MCSGDRHLPGKFGATSSTCVRYAYISTPCLLIYSYQIANAHIYILQTIIEQAFMDSGFPCHDTFFNQLIRLNVS